MRLSDSAPVGEPDGRRIVLGERARPLIARALSLQARLTNLLASGLLGLLGVGVLIWYYAHQASHGAEVRRSARQGVLAQAAAEMPLPALGPLPSLMRVAGAAPVRAARGADGGLNPTVRAGLGAALPPVPTMPSLPPLRGGVLSDAASPIAAAPGTRPTVAARRLGGAVFVAAGAMPLIAAASGVSNDGPGASGASSATGVSGDAVGPTTPTAWRLTAPGGAAPYVQANPSLALSKGTFIDCTLQTAIDSTLPGMTTCVTATDTFSADGRVVLLERGTRLIGETQGQVQQGSARIFVLWTEAHTPAGLVVPLESPGADELGRAGLSGRVQRHFWQRFGAAIMVSMIDGGVQAAVQASAHNGGTVIYDPGATQDVMTEVLKSTVAIPPTITKRNGDRIQVMVARDVGFEGVYALRALSRP